MKKKKQNKNKKPSNFGGLFIQKRVDKKGFNYYIDRQGKRRSKFDYSIQWGKKGRISKESFNKTLQETKKEGIKDIREGRLIASDYETLKKSKPLRKKEIEIIESRATKTSLFFRAIDHIKDADKGGAKIKILTPKNTTFREFKGVQGIEKAYEFIDSISKALEELKQAGDEITSPLISFRFQHNIKENTFYFDFKNLIGIEDFILMQELIKDNFSN